jgi:hypothetical protein
MVLSEKIFLSLSRRPNCPIFSKSLAAETVVQRR